MTNQYAHVVLIGHNECGGNGRRNTYTKRFMYGQFLYFRFPEFLESREQPSKDALSNEVARQGSNQPDGWSVCRA